MNIAQLSTPAECAEIAAWCNQGWPTVGGGVVETFRIKYEAGPYVVGDTPELGFYHFKFANGAVHNVGLIRNTYYNGGWPRWMAKPYLAWEVARSAPKVED